MKLAINCVSYGTALIKELPPSSRYKMKGKCGERGTNVGRELEAEPWRNQCEALRRAVCKRERNRESVCKGAGWM
jgi:hypothetical protein